MLTITGYSVELVKDPFGILPGQSYEFLLDLDVPEDDELYTENGIYVRVIFRVEDDRRDIVKYELFERNVNKYVDFELDEEELDRIAAFCRDHYALASE